MTMMEESDSWSNSQYNGALSVRFLQVPDGIRAGAGSADFSGDKVNSRISSGSIGRITQKDIIIKEAAAVKSLQGADKREGHYD